MEVFEIESQEVADKDVASPKVSIFGDRIQGDRKAESLPSAASSSSSDEEESSPVRSPPARRPRLRKGGNIKPVRPSRKTSTPGCTNYDMTCLERLIRTHSIWFQPRVNRDEVEELLAGKESGAFIVRQSSHNNTLALSVKSTEDNEEESIAHYLIQQSENSPTKLSLECSEHTFDNVLSLVYHYSTTKDELPSILALPASLREANSRQNLSSVALLGKDFWKYPMSSNNNENSLKSNKSPVPIRPRRKLSEPVNKVKATEATLEETLNGLQRVSDMLQASLKDLEEEPPSPSSPPIPPPRVSSSPQRVRKLSEISLSPQSQRKTSSNGDNNTMDSLEMLRSNQPIVQLRTKLSEEMFGTTESSTSSSTKQWYSYYRSSIADKMSDYEDIWDATTQQRRKDSTNERCLSPAESEIQFKAYIASKLQDNELSSQCSSPTNTTQPRTSSSLDSMSNSSSSLKSSTESLVFSDENSEYTEVIYSDPLDALEKATDTRISDGHPDYDPNADQNEEAIYEEAGKKLVVQNSSPTQSPKRRKRATISDTSVPILKREEKILQRRSHSYLMQSGPGKLSNRQTETKRLSAVLSRYIKPISKQSWQIDSSSWEFLNKAEETNETAESTTETSKQVDSGLDSTLSFTETKIKKTAQPQQQQEEKSEDKDSVYESEMGTLETNSAESQQYSKSQLAETQQKIKDYIQSELNCEKWLFGKMVSQFLECTKQVHAQHILSTLRNVRQFMNGMKNYLIRHGEGDLHELISEERTKLNSDQFLNVDLLLEESMNTLIIGPLTNYLRQSLQKHLQSIEKTALNTIEEEEDSYKLKSTRDKMAFEDCMRQVKDTLSPLDKLAHLLTGIKVVSNAVDEGDKDEKFCLLLASLIKDFQWLEVDLELLWSLLPTSVLRANGETTYHLTLVSSAININKTGKNPTTDTTSSKTVDQPQTSSLKSCNSTTSQGSVSSPILTVYVPEKNTLASKNVPLRNENGKVKDVESLLTHMMAVANPTDHALYSIIDGQECLLSGEEQPLLIVDQARLQGKHFCAFAYQRKDSQNAWPTQMGLDLSKPTPTNSSS